jgi:hypothetical protein
VNPGPLAWLEDTLEPQSVAMDPDFH